MDSSSENSPVSFRRFPLRKLLTPEALLLAAIVLPIVGALVRNAGAQGAARR